ncbi:MULTISPECIES: hypothetical protein [unclassified Vibrio]|uniref:hypothetical protein n=1 Tax=unclassified Vibrio TaxID=2614977 RepID=UPI00126910C3|nr:MULTISPECIES: hypothetical protein [unclassified Vibrio]QFT40104.1 hypothetical protein FIU99_27310 [Vibrio sp. THAF64]QGM37927.1 hypothetical protein GGC04_26905 [Vibrio sp. THAF191d]QGN73492.1 hypothetical protein GGC03_27265 [Vibrio sp. THAF191c]
MALSKSSLEARIEAVFKRYGFKTHGTNAFAFVVSKAIAEAVVDEIQQNAQVPVTGGSSAGTYKVK